MGTDCVAIARMKGGIYKGRDLDRSYCFDGIENHEEYIQGEKLSIEKALAWCNQRLLTISRYTEEQKIEMFAKNFGEDITPRVAYQVGWVKDFLDFVNLLRMQEVEWLGIFYENHPVYEEVWFDLDQKVNLIKI